LLLTECSEGPHGQEKQEETKESDNKDSAKGSDEEEIASDDEE
jgi:hypothetical protein